MGRPTKSGGSHALEAFVMLVLGTLLSKYPWAYAPPLGAAALLVVRWLRVVTGAGLPVEEQFAGTVRLMVALSFL